MQFSAEEGLQVLDGTGAAVKNLQTRVGEMAQHVRVQATLAEDLDSVLSTYMVACKTTCKSSSRGSHVL